MPEIFTKKALMRTPEDILARCKRYGIDPAKIHELDRYWYTCLVTKMPPVANPKPHPYWHYNRGEHLDRYPMPPGVERGSTEWWRLMGSRARARRKHHRTGCPLFIEGYHDLDTYTPKSDPKRHDRD